MESKSKRFTGETPVGERGEETGRQGRAVGETTCLVPVTREAGVGGGGFSWKSQSLQRRAQNILGRLVGCPKQELPIRGILNGLFSLPPGAHRRLGAARDGCDLSVSADVDPKGREPEAVSSGGSLHQVCLEGPQEQCTTEGTTLYPAFDYYLNAGNCVSWLTHFASLVLAFQVPD